MGYDGVTDVQSSMGDAHEKKESNAVKRVVAKEKANNFVRECGGGSVGPMSLPSRDRARLTRM